MLESFSSGNPAICPMLLDIQLVDLNKGFFKERVKDAYVEKLYFLESNPNILKEISRKCRKDMENEHDFIKLAKNLERTIT